jgi:hypothetical protein
LLPALPAYPTRLHVPDQATAANVDETLEIDLKNPGWAALWAWLWPGAGHLYQGRTAKGILFMVCILGTFFYGMFLGDGRVVFVYGPWKPEMFRWPYLCQVGVGLPAFPAVLQARLADRPLFGGWYLPPRGPQEMDDVHRYLHRYFELGTVFTMIAGLLNVLAIYDAYGGPAYAHEKKNEAAKNDQPVAA